MKKKLCLATVLSMVALASGQVGIPEGFEIVQLTDDSDPPDYMRMNDCGQIVFSKEFDQVFDHLEIVLYDNGSFEQLTHNDVPDRAPEINDFGVIVWQQEIQQNPEFDFPLMMYADGVTEEFTIGGAPKLNNLGHVAFKRFNNQGCENSDANIFFYDGTTVEQITENAQSSQVGGINDYDEITWTQYDFCPASWDSEIMLYSGGEISQLTVSSFEAQQPKINNLGQVVWQVHGVLEEDYLEMWDEGVGPSEVSDWGFAPRINNFGHVAFTRVDDGTGLAMLVIDGELIQLTDGSPSYSPHDINDYGEVLMSMGLVPDNQLSLMRRIRTGDSVSEEGEFDGDVDVDDFNAFQECFTGPGRVDRLCDCRFLDIDHDGDVDCDDFVLFSDAWTDPINSVPFLAECDSPCEGDTNGDGTVDPLDTGFVLSRFGCEVGAGDANCDAADANTDGVVNPLDTGFILARFGDCP